MFPSCLTFLTATASTNVFRHLSLSASLRAYSVYRLFVGALAWKIVNGYIAR